MGWTVEVTEDFEGWWDQLSEDERVSIDGMIRVLEAQGPSMGQPYSADVASSRVAHLRELRIPHGDHAICVLYVADDARAAVVLLIGSTRGTEDEVCSPDEIENADAIYTKYLASRPNRQ